MVCSYSENFNALISEKDKEFEALRNEVSANYCSTAQMEVNKNIE